MKKYLVIGNPISHSLSPQLHNYWLKKNNIKGIYDKEKFNSNELKNLILSVRNNEINGVNITVPFKNEIIPYLDKLSPESKNTRSVNTICLKDNKIIGHNTDIDGFQLALEDTKYEISGKKILILGAGGVVASIIFALKKMKVSKIMISNRTKSKAETLNDLFNDLTIINWGEIPDFDMIINATSLGLNDKDEIKLDFSKIGKGKFFYDIIYNPKETNFLKTGKNLGNKIENGKKMFIYQAAAAFNIWHGIYPKIDENTSKLLD
tara:strand:- start:1681 stop:2472 length:792 start_codon:yes stop_codon:yes gene_type:complete